MATGELMMQSGLQGLWHLNGNSNDSSGFGANGTDTSVTYIPAKFGQGANFNGSASITLPNQSSLKITGPFSIGGWLQTSVGNYWFSSWSANPNTAGFRVGTNSGKPYIRLGKNTGTISGTDYIDFVGNTVITDNKWHLIVTVYDGTNLYHYVDGNLDAQTSWSGNPGYAATSYPYIGETTDTGTGGAFYTGVIDEVFLFAKALTAREIKNYYAWSKGRRTQVC